MPTSGRRHPRLALAGGSGGEPPSWRLMMATRQAVRALDETRRELIKELKRDLDANAVGATT
jgi:hypothetical protein